MQERITLFLHESLLPAAVTRLCIVLPGKHSPDFCVSWWQATTVFVSILMHTLLVLLVGKMWTPIVNSSYCRYHHYTNTAFQLLTMQSKNTPPYTPPISSTFPTFSF
jgi:hypothetical protein